jgi:hypothetical protein
MFGGVSEGGSAFRVGEIASIEVSDQGAPKCGVFYRYRGSLRGNLVLSQVHIGPRL